MTSGADWDLPGHLFTRNCDFEKFDRTINFTTATQGNTTQYTTEQITITPVLNGNVTQSKVPPGQFPA